MRPSKDSFLLLPAYGNSIALFFMGVGFLVLLQSIFSWRFIDKELSSYIIKSCVLLSLLFFALSENLLNVRAGLEGRLRVYMGTLIFSVFMLLFNPLLSYFKEGELAYGISAHELLVNIFIFYFAMVFFKAESWKPSKKDTLSHTDVQERGSE